MENEIQISIDGTDVRPESVQLSDVLKLLQDFYSALIETAKSEGIDKESIHVSLVAIEEGSDRLILVADNHTHRAASRVVSAIENRDDSLIPPFARKPLQKIWKRGLSRDWTIKIDPRIQGHRPAVISPKKPLFRTRLTHGDTSLLCHIVRVGGESSPTVGVRLPNDTPFTASVVNLTLAEQLGKLLYKTVELKGRATWSMRDWSLRKFIVRSIGPYIKEHSDPSGALRNMSEISGGAWDTIDPDQFVDDLRRE